MSTCDQTQSWQSTENPERHSVGEWVDDRGEEDSQNRCVARQCVISGHVQESCLQTYKCVFVSSVCG